MLMSPIKIALRKLLGVRAIWTKGRLGGLPSHHQTEDLRQEVLLRAVEQDALVRHPRAYLATIARNLTIDAARRSRAQGGPALALDDLPEASQPWSAPDQETTLLLKQIILGLPPLYRDVFILNRFVGLTYPEIAARYGVTVKAIEYRMSRALALCEAALRD